MKTQCIAVLSLLLFGLPASGPSSPNRNWQTAQVQQIQRVPNQDIRGDHWEYVLTSGRFAYTLGNGRNDPLYLNSSLGSEVKIASTASDSNHPFDGDEVYVLDVRGKEHKMDLVSVVVADAGCKKP